MSNPNFDLLDFATYLAGALSSLQDIATAHCGSATKNNGRQFITIGPDILDLSYKDGRVKIGIESADIQFGERTWGSTSECATQHITVSPDRPMASIARDVLRRVVAENHEALCKQRAHVAQLRADRELFKVKLAEARTTIDGLHVGQHGDDSREASLYAHGLEAHMTVYNGEESIYVKRVGSISLKDFIAIWRILNVPGEREKVVK